MIQKVKLTTREGKKVMGYRVTVTSDFHSNIAVSYTHLTLPTIA